MQKGVEKMDKVNICGVPHTIERVIDGFKDNSMLGKIEYATCKIQLNSDLTPELEKVTLAHEVIHGILTHLGYTDLSTDDVFVSSMASALCLTFDFKEL